MIVSGGRTGTNLLCKSLSLSFPNVHPNEIFVINVHKASVDFRISILEKNKKFNLNKITYVQSEEQELIDYISSNYKIIHIIRNPLMRALSWQVTQKTNVWNTRTTKKVDPFKINCEYLIREIIYYEKYRNIWDNVADITYSYEQIVSDWDSFISNFLHFCSFEQKKIEKFYEKNFIFEKEMLENRQEIITELEKTKFYGLVKFIS